MMIWFGCSERSMSSELCLWDSASKNFCNDFVDGKLQLWFDSFFSVSEQ
jgi:hypothetical protein